MNIITLFCFLVAMVATDIHAGCDSEFNQHLGNVIQSHKKICQEKEGATLFGTGSVGPAELEQISLSYSCNKQVDVDQARELGMSFVDELVRITNNCRGIRPYLQVFPFDYKNVVVSIRFQKSPEGGVDSLLIGAGRVIYITCDDHTGESRSFYEEPYEEAKRHINE